jgi:multidrug resistance efflux pump
MIASLLAAGAIVLIAWAWWAVRAEVTLYAVSTKARVEIETATYPIASPLTGRVVTVNLQVGQTVRQGDVLVAIDTTADQLELQQEQIRAAGLDPEVARLRAQIAAEEQARAEEQRASRMRAEEAAGRIRQAETEADHAEQDLARIDALARRGLVPPRDLDNAGSDARRLREAVSTLDASARRVPQDQATRDRERDARIASLQADIAQRQAQRAVSLAGVERLHYEIERRTVRAPIDGTIGEAALLRPGAVVREAEPLASIVPAGRLLVAAQFPAEVALGRIRRGQAATLRLDAYPWAEFGGVPATVDRVAGEIRDGMVRVELMIEPQDSQARFRGPLAHGMPGAVDIAVERLTPLALVLRTAGQTLTVGP